MDWFVFLHFTHVAAGVTWAGGQMAMAFMIYPALYEQDRETILRFQRSWGPRAGALMGISGSLILITGPLRAWAGGGVRSLADLGTPYGLLVLSALIVVLLHTGVAEMQRRKMAAIVAANAEPRSLLRPLVQRMKWMTALAMAVIVGIMIGMGLGLY